MEMKKCPNGHYYDASVHAECPYCSGGGNDGVTMPLEGLRGGSAGGGDGKTVALNQAVNSGNSDEGRTVALVRQEQGIDPVVGWLVCVEGKEKGRDYRIHSDNNFIGRSDRMDICVRGDETISRENHAIISYDTVENCYYFSPSDGRAIVRVNGKAIFATVKLNTYDQIMIGKTVFLFVPLCSPEFTWD